MLGEARRAAARDGVQVEFIHADMDSWGLRDSAADVVTLRNVLWTLENPPEALHLAVRLLRPGGKVLVSDGIWRRARDPAMAELTPHLPNACGVSEAHKAGFGGITAWHDRFASHPYGGLYNAPETPIPFFVRTATKPIQRQ